MKQDAQGNMHVDLTNCPPEKRAALKEFQVVIRKPRGRDTVRQTFVGFKMQDKMRALGTLYQLLRMGEKPSNGIKQKRHRNPRTQSSHR
ncbi:hypothetical protein [Yoonia sp.]|uniref:hypothetical protein n=1 Tax=Yoonia sp. TaxID=2212373 RepID=UPI00358FAD97